MKVLHFLTEKVMFDFIFRLMNLHSSNVHEAFRTHIHNQWQVYAVHKTWGKARVTTELQADKVKDSNATRELYYQAEEAEQAGSCQAKGGEGRLKWNR